MLLGEPASAAMSSSSSSSMDATTSSDSVHLTSLLCSLSVLDDKVNQLQSMVAVTAAFSCSEFALAGLMVTLIQEIMVTASTMMFTCQHMALPPPATTIDQLRDESLQFASEPNFYWYSDTYRYNNNGIVTAPAQSEPPLMEAEISYDIVEIETADLLAKYTHYCQICAKGFKRDTNLRMHMRAHGDEYKSSAALSNSLKNMSVRQEVKSKYSCPQEGCRWNSKHKKFQPLKSMISAKNHCRRSHCPKMYVCKRCNRKQFAVLSDLRTHEKHSGDQHRWQCSCGTTFSRKDKPVGHVVLFVGHAPVVMTNTITSV